jgi:hypothetical protein
VQFWALVSRVARGAGLAARARPWTIVAGALALFALNLVLPPLILSAVRKPWTYFTFNPWLKRLPEYLASDAPWSQKLDFLSRVAIFWFQADGAYGAPEWGFAVDTLDLVRAGGLALLVATYWALWREARGRRRLHGWRVTAGRQGGALGVLTGVIGLSTGPCSVVGCGAPVLPVVGLAFAGLSSATLAFLSAGSRVASAAVLATLAAGVAYLAWQVGGAPDGVSPRRRA